MKNKRVYPVILTPADNIILVEVPDMEILTEGKDYQDAIEMARDAIGLMGIDLEDADRELPSPYSGRIESEKDDIVTLVDIDFSEYRKKVDNRAIKKNCTIPYWMSVEADKAGINYSRLLQDAISNVLGIQKSIN